MVILMVLGFAMILVLQAPGLIKQKMWKELAVFLVFFSLGVLYSIGQVLRWPLPNPTKRMELLFAPAWKMLEKILS